MKSSSPSGNKRPLWQFLLPPMLLASIGLHGVVLFTPVTPSEEDLVPPPDPAEDGIAITKIEAPQPRPNAASQNRTGTQTNPNAATRNTATTGNTQTQARATQSSQRAQSSSPNRSSGRRANRSNRNQAADSNRATPSSNDQDAIAPLPSSDPSVNNPNPDSPDVAAASNNAAAEAGKKLQAYADIFATYQGGKVLTDEESADLQSGWLAAFTAGEDAPYADLDLEIQPLDNFDAIPYETGICLPEPPSTAQILVLVEPDGTVNPDIMQVQSTGYLSFNREALDIVKEHAEFPAADEARAYLAEVEVDYDADNCDWPPEGEGLPGANYFALLDGYIGPTLTTPNEATAAQVAWLTALNESGAVQVDPEEPALPELKGFEQEVPYPMNICLPIAPSDANWGVLVNPDGSIEGEPEMLRSTGYRRFDERSQALVEAFEFPETEHPQAYIIEVPVDYNSLLCQKLDSGDFTTATPPGDLDAIAAASGETDNTTPSENGAADAEASTDESPAIAASEKQQELIEMGRQNLETSEFGSLNSSSPDLISGIIESGWSDDLAQDCFLSELDAMTGPVPADNGLDAFLLTRNVDLVAESLATLYGTRPTEIGQYCEASLQTLDAGEGAQLFLSVVGVGSGNANSLIVVWPSDPRNDE